MELNTNRVIHTKELATLLGTTPGAINCALSRYRNLGANPGFPLPIKIRGRNTWYATSIQDYLDKKALEQTTLWELVSTKPQTNSGRPRKC